MENQTQEAAGMKGGAAPQESAPNPFQRSGLFVKSGDVWRPMKVCFEGWSKSGKSTTLALLALGIWIAEGRRKNLVVVDTEDASLFFRRIFEPEGLIEGKNLFFTPTRSLTDWNEILADCIKDDAIMLTDSTTHLYEHMVKVYLEANDRSTLQVQDHTFLKPKWKELFSDPYVKASCHSLFTGRAAWEYEMEMNTETNKREFYKAGVKMRGDNETAYEADLIVLMERVQEPHGRKGIKVFRRATILGDRSGILDGKMFNDPTFKEFEPYYKLLCAGKGKKGEMRQGSMEGILKAGADRAWFENRRKAEIFLEEIEGLFRSYLPGQGPKEKKVQADIFYTVFDTRSMTALGGMRAETLEEGKKAVEFLLQDLTSKRDWLAKMQEDKTQPFDLASYITERFEAYKKGGNADDDIPIFSSAKPAAGNGEEPGAPRQLCMDDIILAIGEQTIEKAVDDLIVTHASVIAKLAAKERRKIENAVAIKKGQLGKAATDKVAELNLTS